MHKQRETNLISQGVETRCVVRFRKGASSIHKLMPVCRRRRPRKQKQRKRAMFCKGCHSLHDLFSLSHSKNKSVVLCGPRGVRNYLN